MERAARRIEHAQGWATEENTWSEINEHGELVWKPRATEDKIPQNVTDMENLTGEQSAIRIVQEVLKDKINALSSWEDFHNTLSLKGMKYEKKGSGAVIFVGDIAVKASSVSKNLTIAKLEKRFGQFKEIHHLAQIIYDDKSKSVSKNSKPLDKSNDNDFWKTYISERTKHNSTLKSSKTKLTAINRQEREFLKIRQRDERNALLAKLRENHYPRTFLNQQRAVLATQHAFELATLQANHKKQREEQKRSAAKFIPYEQWLREKGLSEQAELWRHRRNRSFLQLECPDKESAQNNFHMPNGILGFTMATTGHGTKFSREGTPGRASFIDVGKVIRVYDQNDDAILAALQLAQQKWGGVQVNGTDEYKRKCAEIAAKNGIRVVNPELCEIKRSPKHANPFAVAYELAQEKIGEGKIIITSAMERKEYSGELLGIFEYESRFYALHRHYENQLILHSTRREDIPTLEALVGRDVEISVNCDGISNISDSGSRYERLERKIYRGR